MKFHKINQERINIVFNNIYVSYFNIINIYFKSLENSILRTVLTKFCLKLYFVKIRKKFKFLNINSFFFECNDKEYS